MKRIFILLIPILESFILPAQNILQHKTDSVSRLVLKEFNNKDIAALYALAGDSFKKSLPFETFSSICTKNLFPLGEMKEAVFEKESNGINTYKAVFSSMNLSLILGLDNSDKILTLFFKPYVEEVKEYKRPQTPMPPFPYNSDDVVYMNADKSLQYGATLNYPKSDSTHISAKTITYPAIILITGSGQQDRDENLFDHKPFAIIADYLTRNGFVVLRVDDRGIGKSSGNFGQATTADFAKDVEASLDFLEKQPMVNKEKIGLIGHSEGGMIAPMVADERKEIKFIVLLAGPGIPIIDLMQQQREAVSLSEGSTPAEAKAAGQLMHMVCEEAGKNEDSATTVKKIRIKIETWSKTLDTATLAKIKGNDTSSINNQIAQAMALLNGKWYKYFISFNSQPYLQKLNCKVLALNGSKDVQVVAEPNLNGVKSSLKKSKSPEYEVIEIPGLNHLFQTCNKCSPSEYKDLEESFSPKALDIMGSWLQKNVQ